MEAAAVGQAEPAGAARVVEDEGAVVGVVVEVEVAVAVVAEAADPKA